MKIENISFSMKVNIGNYGEYISIMQTASLPELESNEAERDHAYNELVKDCIFKLKSTVSELKREKETIIFQNLDNNPIQNNVTSEVDKRQENSVSFPTFSNENIQGLPDISQFQVPPVESVPSGGLEMHQVDQSTSIPPVDLNFRVDIPSV